MSEFFDAVLNAVDTVRYLIDCKPITLERARRMVGDDKMNRCLGELDATGTTQPEVLTVVEIQRINGKRYLVVGRLGERGLIDSSSRAVYVDLQKHRRKGGRRDRLCRWRK